MDYKKLLEIRSKKNAFANMAGIHVIELDEGHAVAELHVNPNHLNPIGSVHGGCLYTMADIAAGTAASTYGYNATTLCSDIHYLNAGLNTSYLRAEARAIKHGKRTMVFEVNIQDQDNTLLCKATVTFMSLGTPIILD